MLLKIFKIYLLFSFLVLNISVVAQTKIDSIQGVLNNETDTLKQISLLLELNLEYRNINARVAVEMAEAAIVLSKSVNNRHFESKAYYDLAKTYFVQYAYSKALVYFGKSSMLKKELLSVSPKDTVFLAELALVYYNTGNVHNAIGIIDSALIYYKKGLETNKLFNNRIEIAWTFFSISGTYSHKGDYPNAGFYLDSAIIYFKELGDSKGLSNSWNSYGNLYREQGNYPIALQYYLQSKQINEENNDMHGLANANNNIANVYKFQGEYKEALKSYLSSLKIRFQINDIQGQTESYNNIGSVYFQLAETDSCYIDSALVFYDKCMKHSELTNNSNMKATATYNIGGIYLFKNEGDSAIAYFNRAKELSLMILNMPVYVQTLTSTGELYNRQKKYKEAVIILDEAKVMSQMIDAHEFVRDIAYLQSQSYFSLGDYKKAFEHLIEYQKVAGVLENKENTKKIDKLNLRYEFEKKQKELEFQKKQSDLKAQAELKQQKLIRNIFVLAFGFVVLLAVVLYKNFKRKKRDNQVLQKQKEEIEAQRDEIQDKNDHITIQNETLTEQRDEIQLQKQAIVDSINYASRIQKAVLPPENGLNSIFSDSFIYFMPRDIVSGDFFWYHKTHDRFILVAADCTGHGVPAGFMSMLGVSLLNQIIGQDPDLHADEILNQLRKMVISSLHQQGTVVETKDGMDLSLLIFDKDYKNLEFAGANNPLYLLRNGEVVIYKADKMPIGISFRRINDFQLHSIELQKGDKCYVFSDGYVDQFGGPRNSKYLIKRFRNLLPTIVDKNMSEQREILHQNFLDWKGDGEQIDDILIIGISI